MSTIFATKGEGWEEEFYRQDDGSFVLVTRIETPHADIPDTIASVMSAEEALACFPEYRESILTEMPDV